MAGSANRRLFISAVEPSADVHCAALVRRLRAMAPDLQIRGVGGLKMAQAGCLLIHDPTSRGQIGLGGLGQIGYFIRLLTQVRRLFAQDRPDLVVVCDSPSFNFHVASAAKQLGIPTLFYVAPQLWAWGGWRIRKLRRLCDQLCCILPFEQDWFRQRGIPAVFVGHPMIEPLEDLDANLRDFGFSGDGPMIALMPGSRTSEIRTLWPAMQGIAMRIMQVYPNARFTTVAVNQDRLAQLKASQMGGFNSSYRIDAVYNTAKKADLALVASGSATLEVAAAGCPMVVMYQTNRLAWHMIGRWLVRPKYFCLVNLLADRPVVKEFVPYFNSIEPIVLEVLGLLSNRSLLGQMNRDLLDTVRPLRQRSASVEVSRIILEQLGIIQAAQG